MADDRAGVATPYATAWRSPLAGVLLLPWLSPIACIVAMAFAIGPVLRTPLGVDVAWMLFVSRRWLEGARLYVDIVDYKPPLVFLLGLPIERFSLATGWPEGLVVALACIAGVTFSIAIVHLILQRSRTSEVLIATTLAGGVLAMLTTPARDLGQVDHLMLIAFLPYVVLCARDAVEDVSLAYPLRIGVGLLATLGVALKPPFLIAWIVLLAFVALSRRQLRVLLAIEHVIVGAGMLASAIVVAVAFPEYFGRIVPMAYEHHWLHGDPFDMLAGDWMVMAVTVSSLGLAVTARWLTRDREWSSLVRASAWASLGLFVTFLAQRQAVPDHFLGVRAFNFLAVWLAIVGFVAGHVRAAASGETGTAASHLGLGARITVLTLAVSPVLVVGSMVREVQQFDVANLEQGIRSPYAEPLIDLVQEHAAGKPIFVLSSSVGPAFPLVNLTGATWPYRFNGVAFVSGYYQDLDRPVTATYRQPARQSAAESAFFAAIVDDLTRRPPALLIVDRARLKPGFGWTYFEFLDYYRQSPAFAELLTHYRQIAWRGTYQVLVYQPDRGRPQRSAQVSSY